MKKTNTLIQARDRDFLSHCIALARKMPHLTLSEVVKIALTRRPEYFYIDYERASRIVNRVIKNGGTISYTNECTIRQTEEMVERVREISALRNIPIHKALTHVLNNTRPKQFYISYRNALRIARRKLKNVVTVK